MSRKKRRRQNAASASKQTSQAKLNAEEQDAKYRAFTYVALIVVCALGAIIYSNTFDVPFLFDDIDNIVRNRQIQITELELGQLYTAAMESRAPRPVAYVSFALNYYFGEYNLKGYHLVNLAIHLLNGILVYFLASLTYRLFLRGNQGKLDSSNLRIVGWLSLFAACLFVSHPMQTQAVTYLVQRMTSLSTLFYLLALLLYVHGRLSHTKQVQWLFWFGCLASGILAIGSKQIAITLPVLILLYEWYFFRDLDKEWARHNLKYLLVLLFVLGGISLFFLGTSPWQYLLEGYERRDFTMLERVLTQFRVVMMYLGLLVFPLPSRLNLIHHVSTSHTLFDPITTLFSILAIGGLIWLAIYLARRQRLISFCILWFFLNLALESSVVALEMIYEHRVYLPMFGVVLAVPYLLHKLLENTPYLVAVMAVLLVLSLGRGSYERNEVWGDAYGLWSDVIAKNPYDHRAFICRGNQKQKEGQHDLAIADYTKSIEIQSDYVESYNNRGLSYVELRQHELAFSDYAKAIQYDPEYAPAYANRGKLYQRLGKLQLAIKELTRALEISPEYELAYYNRATVYGMLGKHDLAIDDFSETIRLAPKSAAAYNNRAISYRELGQHELALKDYNKAIELEPESALAYNNRAIAYGHLGQYDAAIRGFTKAIELRPGYTMAYHNRGTEYMRLGKHALAIADFSKATQLQQNFAKACRSLAWLLATSPQAQLRNGQRALKYAQRACELSDWKVSICLETLAAAYAENGDYEQAIQWQVKATDLASLNQKSGMRQRLTLYQAGKPYRLQPSQ